MILSEKNVINVVYDIIEGEKEISKIIIEYMYMKTMVDNNGIAVDITSIIGYDIRCINWINNDHFYTFSKIYYSNECINKCFIYRIKKSEIKLLYRLNDFDINTSCEFIKKIIFGENDIILIWIDKKDNSTIIKYDCDKKSVLYTLKIEDYVRDIIKIRDELIVSKDTTICKINYENGILQKSVNMSPYKNHRFIENTIFCISKLDSKISLININDFSVKHTFEDSMYGVNSMHYDYNNETIIAFKKRVYKARCINNINKVNIYDYSKIYPNNKTSLISKICGNVLFYNSERAYVHSLNMHYLHTNKLIEQFIVEYGAKFDTVYPSTQGQYIIYYTDFAHWYLVY